MGDVSGKVWSTLITTQQAGIYPRTSLGFAIYRVSSPAPIYWHFALRVYWPCANILALCVLSVKPVNSVFKLVDLLSNIQSDMVPFRNEARLNGLKAG